MLHDDDTDHILHENLRAIGPLLGEPRHWNDGPLVMHSRWRAWRTALLGISAAAVVACGVWVAVSFQPVAILDAPAIFAAARAELLGGKPRRIVIEGVDLEGAELSGTLMVSRIPPVARSYAELYLTLKPSQLSSKPLIHRAVSAQEGVLGWLFVDYGIGPSPDGSVFMQQDFHPSITCDWFSDATCLIGKLPIRFGINTGGVVTDYVLDNTHRDHIAKVLRLIGTLIDGSHGEDVLAMLGERAEDVSLDPLNPGSFAMRTTLTLAPPKMPTTMSLKLRYDSQTQQIVSMSASKPDPSASFGRHVRMIDSLLGPMSRESLVKSFEEAGAAVTVTDEDERFSEIIAKDVVVNRWLKMPTIAPTLFDSIDISLRVDQRTGMLREITLEGIGVSKGVARVTFEQEFDESLLSPDRWITPSTRIIP